MKFYCDNTNILLNLSEENQKKFQEATECHLCTKIIELVKAEKRDHSHATG